ncbi:MAG TPA: hypothetical protein VFF65_08165, partial [Phycisphaerales bacterium]|nr:hypothetical protein [Phycisphaerales bacterium]
MYNIGHWWRDNLPGVGTKFDYTGYPSNLDWSWGPTSPDFPPVSQSLADDTVALVPADARAVNNASRAFGTRPTIENSIDLITGRPLVKETDLELAFGGATFRYTRTFSKMNDHEGVLRRDGANASNFAFLPVGRQEFCWDWHGEGWMSNLSPLVLIDAAYHEILGQGDNSTASNHTPPRRRTWFVLDAHRSIPFDRDPVTGNYTCPAQFDAKLIPVGGTWTTDTTPEGGHWQIFPTHYKVILRDSLTYTVEVQPDELPYMSCPDEAGNPVLASAAPDLNRPGQPARIGMGGRGAPRHGFTKQIDDNYGHSVRITHAPRREWVVNDPDVNGDPRPVIVDNHHEWGQVRSVKLVRNAGPQETVEWTLLFQYRAFWGDAGWRLGGLQDPPRFGVQETWNLERNGQPTVNGEFAALFKPTAVHRIYVYRGFDTALANFISQQPEWDWLDGSPDGWTLQGKKFTRPTAQRLDLPEADAIESAYPAGWSHKVSYLYQDMEALTGQGADTIQDVHGLGQRNAADGLIEYSPTGDEHKPLLRKSEVSTRSSSQPTDISSQRRLYFYRLMAEFVITPSGTVDLGYILDEEGVADVIREMESARAENLDTDLNNGTVHVAWPSPVGGGAPVTIYEGGIQPFTAYTVLRSDLPFNQPYAYRDSAGVLKQKYIYDHATISLSSNRDTTLDDLHGLPGVAGMVQNHLGLSPSQLARMVFDRESVLRGAVLRRRSG